MGNPQKNKSPIERLSRIPILMYHKIENRREVGINVLSPHRFRQHLAYLYEAGFKTVTFQQLSKGLRLPEKPLIISFDDAYESAYFQAFPLLKEFGFVAVAYVIGGFVGKYNDWDANLGGIQFRHCSKTQLGELDKAGWELGAHTMTHRALTFLGSDEVDREINESIQRIQDITNQPVVSLAYPFGLHNQQVREIAQKRGIQFGCKSIRGKYRRDDLLQLPRIPVYQFESVKAIRRKTTSPNLPPLEKLKLSFLSWPANLTPYYQMLVKQDIGL